MLVVVALPYRYKLSPFRSQGQVKSPGIDIQYSQHEDTRHGKLLPFGQLQFPDARQRNYEYGNIDQEVRDCERIVEWKPIDAV